MAAVSTPQHLESRGPGEGWSFASATPLHQCPELLRDQHSALLKRVPKVHPLRLLRWLKLPNHALIHDTVDQIHAHNLSPQPVGLPVLISGCVQDVIDPADQEWAEASDEQVAHFKQLDREVDLASDISCCQTVRTRPFQSATSASMHTI